MVCIEVRFRVPSIRFSGVIEKALQPGKLENRYTQATVGVDV